RQRQRQRQRQQEAGRGRRRRHEHDAEPGGPWREPRRLEKEAGYGEQRPQWGRKGL
ncbi:hypothetical protein E4U41_004910, partial [Claviceps citrina]